MPSAHAFLQNLALVLCVAALTTVVSQRLRLPVIFGYLVAGMLVGPHVPTPFGADEAMISALAELGVVLLMYSLGLEFRVARVVEIGGAAGLAALAETALMFGLGHAAAGLLGWTPAERLFAGAAVAISSTTVIAKTFAEQGVRGRLREIVLGVLLVEDLIAVLLITVLTAVGGAGRAPGPGELAMTGLHLAAFLATLLGVGLLVVPRLVRAVVRLGRAETIVVTAVGVCFAAALLALTFGYSVALGAFVAGSLVAESGHGARLDEMLAPLRDVFAALFFVAVGMLIDPAVLAAHWGAVLALTAAVLVGKPLAVAVGVFLTGNGLRESVRAGMSLAQIGEFSFIIAGVGLAAGATRPFLYPVAVAVAAITTLTTPWMTRAGEGVARAVDRKLPPALQTFAALYGTWVERLRRAPARDERRATRRLVRRVLRDAALLAGALIAAALELDRLAGLARRGFGLGAAAARGVVLALVLAAAVPLAAGLVRSTRRLAVDLAQRALPGPGGRGLDRAVAPRGALVAALHLGMLLAAAVPLVALLQPFVPGLPVVGVLVALAFGLGLVVWHTATSLYGHTRAGAEVIALALAQHDRALAGDDELARAMARVSDVLPGLGAPEPARLGAGSPAVGRTLRDLDLRGVTGATVLAIARPAGGDLEPRLPTGREVLAAGDVLALAGTRAAVDAARALLGAPGVPPPPGPTPAAAGPVSAASAP
jgi:CPA2 family monovalent cation:H+ antiporter-2